MPSNNGHVRKTERKRDAQTRWVAGNDSGLTVAEREAERGHDQRLRAESQESTP